MNTEIIAPLSAFARQRRWHEFAITAAVVWTLTISVVALFALLDLLLPFPRPVRIGIGSVGAVTIVIWLMTRWREATRRHIPHSAAQAVESAHPEWGQKLRTALEIAQRGVADDAFPEAKLFSARLIAQSRELLSRISFDQLLPRRRLAAWVVGGLAVLTVICVAIFESSDFRLAVTRMIWPTTAATYTRIQWTVAPPLFDDRHPPRVEVRIDRRLREPTLFIREPGGAWTKTAMTPLPDGRTWDVVLTGRTRDLELYAVAGDGVTRRHAIKFEPIAKLVASHVHLVFPEYTGRPPEDRKQGDISVVEDTRVRWQFVFNVPPRHVDWRIGSDAPQRLVVAPDSLTASADWVAVPGHSNGVVSVLNEAGEAIDSWRVLADGFVDALPTVELIEPVKDQEATSITELPVRIRAKDDFGVSEVGLVLEAAGQRDWVLERVIPERDQRNVSDIAIAMLEKVPLTIRDNVRLFAYALDHKPRGGPRAVSPLRSIDIREFKKHWMFRDGGDGGGNRQQLSDALMKLGRIITTQRGIVSDTFLLRESTRSSGAAVTASARPIGQRELDLSQKAAELHQQWLDENGISRDDATLLDSGRTQMEEAAASLGLSGPASVEQGFTTSDRALSTLLQLRKRLLTILMRGRGGGDEPKPEDRIRPLADLAREAERLAREEADIRQQLAPEAAAGTNLEATRRQHEVAVNDGGELYSAIVDHPQTTDAAIRLMGDAEKAFRTADEILHGPTPGTAVPSLAAAEQRLLETAEFLRAMELTQIAETLKRFAQKAEKGGQATRESVRDEKEKEPSEGAQDASRAPRKGDGTAQIARETGLADDVLGALTEKAGAANNAADLEAETTEKNVGQTLSELREQTAPGKLAAELGRLADMQKRGVDSTTDLRALGESAADKLQKMGAALRDAARRLEASLAARLAAAQAQAKELQRQLGSAGVKPSTKSGGKPGETPGQNGANPSGQPGGKTPLAKGNTPNGNGQGEKPDDAKNGGRGGIAGDLQNAREGGGGQAMGRFSNTLRGVGDDQLNNFAIKLFNAPFSLESLPLVDAAAERIEQLLAALPLSPTPLAATGRIPEARRREIEDYFRDLSNDFGGEEWGAPAAPGQRAE